MPDTLQLPSLKFVKDFQNKKSDYVLIQVDTDKLDEAWSQDNGFYIPRGGPSDIGNRRERFEEWLSKNPETPVEAPFVGWNAYKNCVSFTNGRHRFSVLRDLGYPAVCVTIAREDLKNMKPFMVTGKTASPAPIDFGKIQNILTEMMQNDVLSGLPRPNLKVVNHTQSSWVGRDTWPPSYGEHPETTTPDGQKTTFIELQKYICHDEHTVRRILAHELCHHEEFFVGFNTTPRERNTRRRIEGSHGPTWQGIVARWNAKYGADFITVTSDEADIKVHDEKNFWVYLIKEPTRILWQTSISLTPKARRYMLMDGLSPSGVTEALSTGRKPNRKLCITTDRDFLIRGGSIGDGWYSKKDAAITAKAAELYENGVDVFKKEVTDVLQPTGEATTKVKPFYVLIHKQGYGSRDYYWEQASTLNPAQKSTLQVYARRVARGASETKLVMSTNPLLKAGARIGGKSYTWPRTDLEKAALEEAWNQPDILSQFGDNTVNKDAPKTAAPVSDPMKSQIYYHGTGSEAAAQAIIKDGIQPRDIIMPDKAKSRAQLAPVPDRVYLTASMGYASIYALGGQMFGTGLHDQSQTNYTAAQWLANHTKEGAYGYIFEIHGSQLTGDVVPDEDSIGEALDWLASDIKDSRRIENITKHNEKEKWNGELAGLQRSMEIIKKQRINQPDVPESVRTELYHLYIWKLTDRQKQNLSEVGTQAQVGKKLQKFLSQETCRWMIENGAHVAHQGPIFPTHCKRFSKEKALYTTKLGEILEDVPLLHKTAAPVGEVDTPDFKTWFAGSKIVGKNGRPKFVYHGTSAGDFETFKIPAYFSDNLKYTKDFGGRTVRAYLNMKNPLYMDTRGQRGDGVKGEFMSEEDPIHVEESLIRKPEWRAEKQSQGYDGVVITDFDGKDYNLHVYLPFNADQIWIADQGEYKYASPDFGYTHYNDREQYLKNVKISLKGPLPRGGEGDIELVAEYGDRQIGGIDCWKVTRQCSVNGIYIDAEWRGTGLGQMLYDAAIQAAKKAGCRFFVSDGQLRDDAVSAWQRLAKRYRVEEIDNPDYLVGVEEEDEDDPAGYSGYDNGEVDQHPVRYQIDLNTVPLQAKGRKAAGEESEGSGDPFWERVKADMMAGIVYHGTTVEIAEIIQKTGFRGLDFDAILKDVMAKYGMTEVPKRMRKVMEGTKNSYSAENGLVSTCPGGYIPIQYAGDGGEVPKQVEAYPVGKYSTRDVKDSRIKGQDAVVKCRIRNFEGSDNYRRAKEITEGLERWFTTAPEGDRRRTPREAAEHIWMNYTNFLCKPEDLEVISVITGSQLDQLAKAPLGVTSE